ITFSTDSFSPYALAYTDNAADNGSNNGTNNSGTNGTSGNRATSAKTGDNANVMLYLILAAASLAGGVTVYTKKKKSYR
ncbi:MAG: LPXTG cell wall anchor domain-containing protein, partial [Lachnospiraceae bacterium]|nr:LPXTG cell wall anchor domain-containing protein [Lachnospiraceae bacterium]